MLNFLFSFKLCRQRKISAIFEWLSICYLFQINGKRLKRPGLIGLNFQVPCQSSRELISFHFSLLRVYWETESNVFAKSTCFLSQRLPLISHVRKTKWTVTTWTEVLKVYMQSLGSLKMLNAYPIPNKSKLLISTLAKPKMFFILGFGLTHLIESRNTFFINPTVFNMWAILNILSPPF